MNRREKCYNCEKKIFKIPLNDGGVAFIYVFHYEQFLGSFFCGVFNEKNNLSKYQFISFLFSTPETFLRKRWVEFPTPALGFNIKLPKNVENGINMIRNNNYVGARIHGAGVVWHFCQSFFGLEPWDQYAEPDFFDEMLIDPKFKPKNLIYENKV